MLEREQVIPGAPKEARERKVREMQRHEELERLISELCKMRSLEAEVKAEKEALSGAVKALMDELEIEEYFASAATARYKVQVQNTLNSKLLKAEMPEVYQRYAVQKELKQLRIA